MFHTLFNTVLYQPIFNVFVFLYSIIPDVGIVILLLTLLIKVVLYPLTTSSIRAQKSLADLQPKIDAIKKQHAGDQARIAQETMTLYKEHKVNPFGSCLPLLVQLPIFLALYWVLRAGLESPDFALLYPFVKNPEHINTMTLGIFDLHKNNNVILALLAGASQFWQAKMMSRKRPPATAGPGAKDEDMAAIMNKQMLYMLPAITVFVTYSLPSGLALYWTFSTILTIAQQGIIFGKQKKVPSEGA